MRTTQVLTPRVEVHPSVKTWVKPPLFGLTDSTTCVPAGNVVTQVTPQSMAPSSLTTFVFAVSGRVTVNWNGPLPVLDVKLIPVLPANATPATGGKNNNPGRVGVTV